MDPSHSNVVSMITEPQDSEKEQLRKLRSGLAHSFFYPPELNRHLRDQSMAQSMASSLHPAQVNSWYRCASMDGAVPCGLSLASSVRTPGSPGFPMSLQQHALVQVHTHTHTGPKSQCVALNETNGTNNYYFIITPEIFK